LAVAVDLGAELARAPPGSAPSSLGGLLEAVTVCYAAAAVRFGQPPPDGLWGLCSRVSAGRLIAPERRT